jgi:hypothetical protein
VKKDILGILDSGAECMMLPPAIYNFTLTKLLSQLTFYRTSNNYGFIFFCRDVYLLSTIDILFGDYWLELPIGDYVFAISVTTCSFCIKNSYSTSVAFLGLPVLRNFYVAHD